LPVFAALLRGVNVGGHHRVTMVDLRRLFADLGFESVSSYIQSGNVVFASERTDVEELTEEIATRLTEALGFEVGVTLRDAAALRRVTRANPFLARGEGATSLSVAFLSTEPTEERVQATTADPDLERLASHGEEFVISGSEIYLFHPQGFGSSKINNAFFDRRLGASTTIRNWRSVEALCEMAEDAS
jgi:uncharacterized protein (DUF1697 family)